MGFAREISDLLWKLDAGVRRRVEAELHRFSFGTEVFIKGLLDDGLPSDWRDRLTAHLDTWRHDSPGFIVKNCPVLEQFIIDWADALGLNVDGDVRRQIAKESGKSSPLCVGREETTGSATKGTKPTNESANAKEERELLAGAPTFAAMEQRRLGLTDDERQQLAAFLQEVIRRQFRGEPPREKPQFWLDKDRQWAEAQRKAVTISGISAEEAARREREYKLRNLDKLPEDERNKLLNEERWAARERYIAAEGGGLLAHLKAFLNPAFDGTGTFNDAAMVISGFTGVQGLGPKNAGPPEPLPTSRVRPAAGQGAQLPAPRKSRGVWDLGPATRGNVIHKRMRENLPPSFPVIDRFDNGIATSIKSMDLTTPTYRDANAILRVGEGYISDLADFQGAKRGKSVVTREGILARELRLVVPNKGSVEQQKALNQLIGFGKSRSVTVTIVEMPK